MKIKITAQQVREIAAAEICNEKTVRKVYAGLPCRETTRERVRRTARALGIALPPKPAPEPVFHVKGAE